MAEASERTRANMEAARRAKRAKVEAEKRNAAENLRGRRNQQTESTGLAVPKLEEGLRRVLATKMPCEALSNHLLGFYAEVDKLAKGKTLVEVTDLVVQQANDIVRDAKALTETDVHLNRVKEFVPAGNNPVYPDVLLTARTVQQSLERLHSELEREQSLLTGLLREARTIEAALRCYLDGDNSNVSERDVRAILDDNVSESWFQGNFGERYFDFARLDRINLEASFRPKSTREDLEQ